MLQCSCSSSSVVLPFLRTHLYSQPFCPKCLFVGASAASIVEIASVYVVLHLEQETDSPTFEQKSRLDVLKHLGVYDYRQQILANKPALRLHCSSNCHIAGLDDAYVPYMRYDLLYHT